MDLIEGILGHVSRNMLSTRGRDHEEGLAHPKVGSREANPILKPNQYQKSLKDQTINCGCFPYPQIHVGANFIDFGVG